MLSFKIKKLHWHWTLISILFSVLTAPSLSQDRCGAVEYQQLLQSNNFLYEDDRTFEQWLNRKVSDKMLRIGSVETAFRIPVVVHVIHKGEPLGSGSNITDEQIASQINVLNQDFRRTNADTINTPNEFRNAAGKLNIEFVLAKQTPEGLATNGILRVKGSMDQWTINDDVTLKASSYWPAEDYLNIWVTDLTASLIGYAQFPVSALPGLDDAIDNRLTDGVVVDYMAFGSVDDGDFDLYDNYNKGRAATHEIGHFFGLRHIWGDEEGCGGDGDYVADTPDQTENTSGCPSHPYATCTAYTMFQNYMDYTNDQCMNIFTQGQVTRIETVLENSPRRKSLASSPGLVIPITLDNDIGIHQIVSPSAKACDDSIMPMVRVKNNGANAITSAILKITVDDQLVETRTFNFNPALTVSQTADVVFSPVTRDPGDHSFTFDVVQTNGITDAKLADNKKSIVVSIAHNISLPAIETFDVFPSGWTIQDTDQIITWAISTAKQTSSTNQAVYMNFYEYQDAVGEMDILLSPIFDLPTTGNPYLIFDIAYAQYQDKQDGLKIYILSDCASVESGVEIYSGYGSSLATVAASSISFVPSGAGDWRSEAIDLSDFTGRSNLQLAFVGVNDWGNNLYLDNVKIIDNLFEDVAIQKVDNPSPVHCSSEVQPSLTIKNTGKVPVTRLTIAYSVNQGEVQTFSISDNFILSQGDSTAITLPVVTLSSGENTISFEAKEPNGLVDIRPANNRIDIKTIFNPMTDKIPLRENFDNDDWDERWSNINPFGETSWEVTTTNFNNSLYYDDYNTPSVGEQAWLVTPVLNFSDISEASVFFDISYRSRNSGNDKFQVLASRDCGINFTEVLYDGSEDTTSDNNDTSQWKPVGISDWKQNHINLNSLAGEDQARLAFVFTNGKGNNFYIDNIEFYVSDDASPIRHENLYSIYGNGAESTDFYITFNLESKQPVAYELVDILGKRIAKQELTEVLNQTFLIECQNASSGIYIIRLLIDGQCYSDRIYLGQ